jgi:hypothetical protein
MSDVPITPSDRFRRLVVLPDVLAYATRQIRDGREDASRQQVAFDFENQSSI